MMEPYPPYQIGLDYVMNAISPPHQVRIADMNELKDGGDTLAGVLSRYQPDLIGLSIKNIDNIDEANVKTFIDEIRELIGIIREHSGGFIVLGGSGSVTSIGDHNKPDKSCATNPDSLRASGSFSYFLDTQLISIYTSPVKKQYLIKQTETNDKPKGSRDKLYDFRSCPC
jgi:hypothetical protein